jgi:L-seryl-tRNA(Ser) seleniumtransferase
MPAKKTNHHNIPSVNVLLNSPEIQKQIQLYGKEFVVFAVRKTLSEVRSEKEPSRLPDIQQNILNLIKQLSKKSLKPVINATGIIIHTNLGRAPISKSTWTESLEVLNGYNNLEFNLEKGTRGNRNQHASEIIKFLTGAEDVLVVNNNAAAVMLVLRVLAKGKEVVVSRGELIEIGGSFRIPDIMEASDCKMIEVGTTNKTKIEDYEKAINKETAVLFKAHKSNYIIRGFTAEVSLDELIQIGKKHKKPVLFDMGSGIIKRISHPILQKEPTVQEAIASGVDLVCFSGDKLLGGPQSGIICGKKKWIDKIKKNPMHRALRVGKTTLALLETTCIHFLSEKELFEKNFIYKIFNRKPEEIQHCAEFLVNELKKHNISSEVIKSKGQCGGGALPEENIQSFAVKIIASGTNQEREVYAENLYKHLLLQETPVLAILKKGTLQLDLLTLFKEDLIKLVEIIVKANQEVLSKL